MRVLSRISRYSMLCTCDACLGTLTKPSKKPFKRQAIVRVFISKRCWHQLVVLWACGFSVKSVANSLELYLVGTLPRGLPGHAVRGLHSPAHSSYS